MKITPRTKAVLAALTVVLAAGAFASGVAFALTQGHLKAEKYTALGSAGPGVGPNYFSGFGSTVFCRTGTGSSEIKSETTSVTVALTYSGCISGERAATVVMNGCTYTFHIGMGEGDSWGLTADLTCPSEKKVEINVYNNKEHTELFCTFSIPAQKERTGLAALNETEEGIVTAEGTVEGLSATEKGVCTFGVEVKTTSATFGLSGLLSGSSEEAYDGLKIG